MLVVLGVHQEGIMPMMVVAVVEPGVQERLVLGITLPELPVSVD
jgi:hypothetical protein